MMYETVFDNEDVRAGVSPSGLLVHIVVRGKYNILLTPYELAHIAEAVEQHLEIESAAEYIDELFTEEDLAAGHRAIAEYIEALPKEGT